MTEKQKEAIVLLNGLANGEIIRLERDEYFLLLEFVMSENQKSVEWYPYIPQTIPTYPYYPQQPTIQPYYTTTTNPTIK